MADWAPPEAAVPEPKWAPTEAVQEPEPQAGGMAGNSDWHSLYSGMEGLDGRLSDNQRKAFSLLDSTQNPKEERAKAINQAYVQTQMPHLSPDTITRNWGAVKNIYTKHMLGMDQKDVPDTALYSAIGKKFEDEQNEWNQFSMVMQNSLVPFSPETVPTIHRLMSTPMVDLPEAPKYLPNLPQLGLGNPALVGGVWNAIKPILEGLETGYGVATLGVGAELKTLSETYPLAKGALVSMSGVFAGLFAHSTYKGAKEAPKILKDPNATFVEKVTAVASPVLNGMMAVLGAMGTAFEMFPKGEAEPLAKSLEGKDPAQAAIVLRNEAEKTDVPGHAEALNHAADKLEEISTPENGPKPAPAKFIGNQEMPGHPDVELYNLEEDIQGHPKDSTVSRQTLEKQNYTVPPVLDEKPTTPVTPDTAVGIRNEAIDAELEKMGLEPAEHGEKTSFQAALDDAAKKMEEDPQAGEKLVAELKGEIRPITGNEDALLLREQNRLRLERDEAEKALSEAKDETEKSSALLRVAKARDDFQTASDIATKVGTANAQGLALRQMMMKEDYSLAGLEKRMVDANQGKPLSETQSAEVKDLHRQLMEAQKKLDEYAARKRAPKSGDSVSRFLSKKADEARARIKARMAEGRVQSGLDPLDVADHVIVGADYIAKGLTKFADWSTEMVKEFGEQIKPCLQEIFNKANDEKKNADKLVAYKARTKSAIEKTQGKLASGDFAKQQRKTMEMDVEATKLRGELQRVKRKVQLKQFEIEAKNRTPMQKGKDLALSVERAGVLSRAAIVLKLSTIIAARSVMTPIRQGIGLAVSKALPSVAKSARFEDVPSFGGYVRSEAKAITAMLTKGLPGAWDILKMKDTDLQALLEKEHLPPGVLSYPAHIHAALHYPIQVADYARRLQLVSERDIRAGIDMSEPVNQLRNMQEAWEYSKRSIFLQNNKLVNGYKALISTLNSEEKTGGFNPAARMLAFALQAENPVVRVPVNLAEEVGEHVFGLLDPPVRLAFKGAGGFKGLSYGEADMVLRHIKNGSLGAALVLLGFFKYKQVGGFYEQGEKRKKSDAQPGEIKAGGVTVPSLLLKDTSFEALNAGSTLHRTLDSIYRLNDPQKKGIPAALLAVAVGIADENPFFRNSILSKLADPRQREHALAADIAGKVIPGIVQEAAAQTDKKTPFSPFETANPRVITAPDFGGALKQNLEKEIPGLRENLPKKRNNFSLRP